MNTKRGIIWLLIGLLVLGTTACGAVENEPAAGESPGEGGGGEAPEDLESAEDDPTVEGAKGDQGVLEELGGGFVWRREGGIAGFCDVVTVLAGTANVATCATEPPEIVGEVTLTNEQSQQVNTWLEELAPFTHEEQDPATADALAITIVFEGQGDGEATDEDIAAIDALAVEVLRVVGN